MSQDSGFLIEITGKEGADGFEHVIVRGRTNDDPEGMKAMGIQIKDALYKGHSVWERIPLEFSQQRDLPSRKVFFGLYHRFYRKLGEEWIKRIDHSLSEEVVAAGKRGEAEE